MGGSSKRYELAGWILFVVSSLFFMASSVIAGDPVSFIGGFLFFLACVVFLYALHGRPGRGQ
ncbi:MAG: hypothetical protein WB783_00425 [Arenicellales bacterium]